jgi:hypothetical protein
MSHNNLTISGRKINATPNHRNRTFTIRTESGKYRTFPMNKAEFRSCLHNTANDWQNYLKYDQYEVIK